MNLLNQRLVLLLVFLSVLAWGDEALTPIFKAVIIYGLVMFVFRWIRPVIPIIATVYVALMIKKIIDDHQGISE